MIWKALIVPILVLLALGIADARMPQVGDHVYIETSQPGINYQGKITDIGNGLICLKCDPNSRSSPNKDVCIGTGSIIGLEWL